MDNNFNPQNQPEQQFGATNQGVPVQSEFQQTWVQSQVHSAETQPQQATNYEQVAAPASSVEFQQNAQPISPMAPQQTAQEFQPIVLDNPKKSKAPLIIATIIASVIILGASAVALFFALKPRDFSYLIDKNSTCEFKTTGERSFTVEFDAKFSKDKKVELAVNFLGKVKVSGDYKIISQDNKAAVLELSNITTEALGESKKSEEASKVTVNLENLKEDKFTISPEKTDSTATVPGNLECKIKKES